MNQNQIKFMKQVIALSEQNPDAEIVFAVPSEETLDDHHWTAHEIVSVELGFSYKPTGNDERMFDDRDGIIDAIMFCDDVSEEVAIKKMETEGKKTIFVRTTWSEQCE